MTPEQKFYQWFRKQLPHGADCVRIETTTMGGMPDVNVCYKGIEIWVELKCFVNGRVLIRPQQNAWMHRRKFRGGKVFLIADHSSGIHVWVPEFLSVPHGKYLWVDTKPTFIGKHDKSLISFLFT